MLENKNRFRHQSLQDSESIQELLNSIATGIKKGEITFSDQDGEIRLEPKGLLDLKVTASEEESRHRLELRISWQSDQPLKSNSLSVK
jgi:amphi-Trp domain-containing protein